MVSEFLEQVAVWCTGGGMGARSIGDEVLQVQGTSANPAVLSYSVDRLWFQQRVDVPDPTTDAAVISACRLTNLARRGILNARWRGEFIEVTGSLQQEDCTREAVMWLFEEAATLANLIARQLGPT